MELSPAWLALSPLFLTRLVNLFSVNLRYKCKDFNLWEDSRHVQNTISGKWVPGTILESMYTNGPMSFIECKLFYFFWTSRVEYTIIHGVETVLPVAVKYLSKLYDRHVDRCVLAFSAKMDLSTLSEVLDSQHYGSIFDHSNHLAPPLSCRHRR